jgi:hypothetical protein
MNIATPAVKSGIVPFVYDDIAALADWRERLHWPVAQSEIVSVGARVPGAILGFAAGLADAEVRQIAIVAAGLFANGFMSLLEAAWASERAQRLGLALMGGPPEMPLLAAGRRDFKALEYRGPFGVNPAPRGFLRGIARAASWTPAWRLPLTLAAPEAVAISHNHLLRQAARKRRVAYRHAANVVAAARAQGPRQNGDAGRLVDGALDALLPLVPDLGETYRQRLRDVFRARLGNALARVAADVAALRHAALPKAIWSGTNGAYATRVIAAEVRRRGGSVDVFDHGGATAIAQLPGSTAVIEMSTASRFRMATPEMASLLAATEAPALAALVNRAEIAGEEGEPLFRRCFRDTTAPTGPKKRIIYIGHPYRGWRQFPLAGLPDVVYWDFQMHLVESLEALDVDLLCKPHPEGHFVSKRNPIEALAPTSYRRFEEHLDDADLFLFDAPTSTTFLEALCTRRPVVLIDRCYAINPAVRPAIEARCRIVPARADAQNRLRVDPAELAAAIREAPREADPFYFRRLTVGTDA